MSRSLKSLLSCLFLTVACTKAPPAAPPPAPKSAAPVAPAAVAPPSAAQVAQQAAVLAVAASQTDGFVVIPAGTYLQGVTAADLEPGALNDAPQHPVTISRAFEIQVTEVTQAQYEKQIGKLQPEQDTRCADCPVVAVSWFEAAGYCNALSKAHKLPQCHTFDALAAHGGATTSAGPSCRGYRLPTEAEWEYAARAGTLGSRYGEVDAVAWVDMNSGVGDALALHPVAKKAPNAWGLHDMLGNVFEWTADWQGDYPTVAVTDPVGPAQGQNRLFRGGSFKAVAAEATAWFRTGYGPKNQVEFLGFRCVRSL